MAYTGQLATGRHGVLYRFGRFELHAEEFRLQSEGLTIPLEPKALHLLLFLVTRPGRLVRKQEILNELWPDVAVTDNALTRCITLLRRALADSSRTPTFIETVPRVGYRFVAAVTAEAEPVQASPAAASVPAVVALPMGAPVSPKMRAGQEHADFPASVRGRALHSLSRFARIAGFSAAVIVCIVAPMEWRRHNAAFVASATRVPMIADDSPSAFRPGVTADSTLPAEAREEYQRGLYFYDRRNGAASAAAFQKVISLAPRYAPGYAGLALALATTNTIDHRLIVPEAESAAKKAISLDPNNGEAYLALGCIQTIFTWQWRDAETNLTHGLQLSPQNATGHIWYAVLLQSQGHQDDAITQAEQAVAIAPLSFYMVRMQASVLYFARHYDDALRILERAREMQPQHPNVVDNWISWADEQRGLYDDAVAHDLLSIQDETGPAQIAKLRSTYQRTGWHGYWQMRLELMASGSRQGCGLYSAGVAYLRVGDKNRAYTLLHSAAAQHCFWLGMVHVDPALDSLRQDPRFSEIERIVDGSETHMADARMGQPSQEERPKWAAPVRH